MCLVESLSKKTEQPYSPRHLNGGVPARVIDTVHPKKFQCVGFYSKRKAYVWSTSGFGIRYRRLWRQRAFLYQGVYLGCLVNLRTTPGRLTGREVRIPFSLMIRRVGGGFLLLSASSMVVRFVHGLIQSRPHANVVLIVVSLGLLVSGCALILVGGRAVVIVVGCL